MDDLLIVGENQSMNKLICELKKKHPVNDLREAKYYLDINVFRSNKNTTKLN